jgi:hypothetical protein
MAETLFIETGSVLSVAVHPVVLFSILDQHVRRNEGQDRVIGASNVSIFERKRGF